MSRRITHDGRGSLRIRFPYDRGLVDLVKRLPNRRWNADERFWSAPDDDVLEVVDLLQPEGFSCDHPTRDLYRTRGGHLELDGGGSASPTSSQPGLFDLGPVSPSPPAPEPGAADDYTVLRLNRQVREIIEGAFPSPIWLVGEISGLNKTAHRRHPTFQLVERGPGGEIVSSINATLFDSTRREIEWALMAADNPFRLEDELSVRVRTRVELYVPWGSYRVIVEELDVNYTLGEAARRREEIVRRLTEAGLIHRNTALTFPALPLRVGLVTSLGSDAFNDVLRTLQESGYAFEVTAHGARVQGRLTESSVLNALQWLASRAARLDVVLICRGGGSRTDLAWFDSEPLGRAVAEFPVPVVLGIGHERDQSVLDAVGWSCKTPTAAARKLVDAVRASLEALERQGLAIVEGSARLIGEERRRHLERAGRIARAVRALLQGTRLELGHRASAIPRAASVLIGRQQAELAASARQLLQGTRRDLDGAGRRVSELARALVPASLRHLGLERERAEARSRRLRSVDPRRVVERGYAILRLPAGNVLTAASDAPVGTTVHAALRKGNLRLKSEGPDNVGKESNGQIDEEEQAAELRRGGRAPGGDSQEDRGG